MPQSLASVLVHLVFSTKDRNPWITLEVERELYPYMGTVMKECDSPALIINGTADHVHLLFSLARTWKLCDVIEEVKKRSSKWIKTKGADFRQFQWQGGYGAFSIGQSLVASTRQYIAKQQDHHRRKSFQEEFRTFLERYEIEYDERFVWD